jgi:hypothetical protein
MAQVRIEIDRGKGWECRQEGFAACTADDVAAMLPAYAIQYPHRAWLDGVVVANAEPQGKGVRK